MDEMRKLTVRVAYVILVAWAVSFVVDIFVPTYEPPPSVHALMVIVAGSLFGESVFRSRRTTDDKKPEPKVEG
jgi:hypothetical protein